ncbi:MAG: hypothetical protein AB7V11_07510 [Pyrinomonadaceae bacterium]
MEIAAGENVAFLEHLLSDKESVHKSAEKVTALFRDILFDEAADALDAKRAARLLMQVDVRNIGDIFGERWNKCSPERQELIVSELLSFPNEKGVTRQAAVAEKLGNSDVATATRIVFHILAGGKPEAPESELSAISKEKEKILRSRFFPSTNKGTQWIKFDSADERVLRRLLSFFVTVAAESKELGQGSTIGFTLQFCRWAHKNLWRAKFEKETESQIGGSINKVVSRLPKSVQDELGRQSGSLASGNRSSDESPTPLPSKPKDGSSDPIPSQGEEAAAQPTASAKDVESAEQKPERSSGDVTVGVPFESKSGNKPKKSSASQNPPFENAEELLRFKQASLAQTSLEIQILQDLLSEQETLSQSNARLKQLFSDAEDEADKHASTAKTQKEKIDTLVSQVNSLEAEQSKLNNSLSSLRSELSQTMKALQEKTHELQKEREEFAQSSESEAKLQIESFKGTLRQKLGPIFANKNKTNEDPASEQLAEFLRKWSRHVETTLKDAGIDI